MTCMGHPGAGQRTKSGYSRVQKGRCYMKPPLGNYHTASQTNPYHSYNRNDSRERMAFQPSVFGDIDMLKRAGYNVPSIEEVVLDSFLAPQPWALCEERPAKSKRRRQSRQSGESKHRKMHCHVPSHAIAPNALEQYEKRKKQEFRQAIIRLGFPAIFWRYINCQTRTWTTTNRRLTIVAQLDSAGNKMEQDLIARAKKGRTTSAKSFTATKIPWKSFLQPQSLTKVARATASFEGSIDNGPTVLGAVSVISDDSESESNSS